MSYILDALRRAEAQRARGGLPNLHAPSLRTASPGDGGGLSQPRRRWLLLAVLFAALLLAGGISAYLRSLPAAAPPPPITQIEPEPVALPSASGVATEAAPVTSAASLPEAAAVVERSAAAPPTSEPVLALPRQALLPVERSAPRSVATPAPAVPSGPSAAAEQADRPMPRDPLPSRLELAADLQRSLPPLSVSGVVYSAERSARMLFVNGELLREGDQIRPDLVVDEIRRRDAVLRFRGQRFSVSP